MIVVTIVVRRRSGLNSAAMLGRFSVPAARFCAQAGDSGRNGRIEDQRQRRNDAGHQRVAPRLVRAVHRGQRRAVRQAESIGQRDERAADGRERLRVAEHALALFRLVEQLREPRDGRDELDADADERGAPEEEELPDGRAEARRQRGHGVDQDAPHEHPPPAEPVRQIAAQQAEHAAGQRRNPEQQADPLVVGRRAGRDVDQLAQVPARPRAAASGARRCRTQSRSRRSRRSATGRASGGTWADHIRGREGESVKG